MSLHPSSITAQNDAFRTGMLTPRMNPKVSGRLVITPGIASLTPAEQVAVVEKVRASMPSPAPTTHMASTISGRSISRARARSFGRSTTTTPI